jgi:hypothetical protein
MLSCANDKRINAKSSCLGMEIGPELLVGHIVRASPRQQAA